MKRVTDIKHGRYWDLPWSLKVKIGVQNAMESLVNLSECPDGIYKVVICNESRDWESGIVDDYDLMLVEYKEAKDVDLR